MKSHPPNFFILPFLQMILSFHQPFLLCFRWSSVDLSRFRSFLLVIFGQSSVSVLSYQSVLGTDLVS